MFLHNFLIDNVLSSVDVIYFASLCKRDFLA